MSQSLTDRPRSIDFLAIDLKRLTFSLSTFIAAALVLIVSFEVSLPRPWWALLTVYVTAQPMAGAFRPKVLYRLGGIGIGAAVSILLVPNLQNSPILLVLCLALWIGFCINLAVLDRTPRAFFFQMASFSTAIISFPYLYDLSDFFTTTISRVEEMTVAILCVTVTHMLLRSTNVRPVIRERAVSFLAHASRWTADALGTRHARLEYEHRRKLAADVTELGMMAGNLPFDQREANIHQLTPLQDLQCVGGTRVHGCPKSLDWRHDARLFDLIRLAIKERTRITRIRRPPDRQVPGGIHEQTLHGCEGLFLHIDEFVRARLRLLKQIEFVCGETSAAHEFLERHRSCSRKVCVMRQPPISAGVVGWPRSFPITDIENLEVLIFVEAVSSRNIRARHARQVVGALPQFIRQLKRLESLFLAADCVVLNIEDLVQNK
jgi:Fusaric acid resistance protein family